MKKVSYLAAIFILTLATFLFVLSSCGGFSEEPKTDIPSKYDISWDSSKKFSLSDDASIVKFEKSSDAPLKVLQLTDIHYDDHNRSETRRNEVKNLIRKTVAETRPDIIAVTGDWTSNSYYLYDYEKAPNGKEYERNVKQDKQIEGLREQRSREIFDLIESLSVEYNAKWAPVFGNHDAEGDVSKYDYADIFAEYRNCLFKAGYSNIKGVGNYAVAVTRNGRLDSCLFFMDSHSAVDGATKYDFIGKSQIAWYEWAVNGFNKAYLSEGNSGSIASMMYVHIPLNEYKTGYKKALNSQNHLIGANREGVYHPYKNSGLFDSISKLKSTKAIFCGHDHDNNSSVIYKDVILSYGVQSGWCDEYATASQKGALLATLKNNGKVLISHVYYPLLSVDEL